MTAAAAEPAADGISPAPTTETNSKPIIRQSLDDDDDLSTVDIRPMRVSDLHKIMQINLDAWTETFNTNFYMTYLCSWPECCAV